MSPGTDSPVDWDEFTRQLDGDAELIEVLRTMFLESVDQQFEHVEQAVAAGEATAIAVAAHTLKGSVAQIFAEQARRMAESIEAKADGRPSNIESFVEAVEELRLQVEAVKALVSSKGQD
jgi:HPt (histidine-containing phosphotransfer) domain-containing protein